MPTPTRGRRHNRVARYILTPGSSAARPSVLATLARRAMRGLAVLTGLGALLAASPQLAAAQVDLVLNVTDTPDPVAATGTVTYAVVISNNGLTTATGVTYTMNVPVNTTYLGFTAGTGASCSGMTVNANGPGTVTCTHPSLASTVDGSFTIQLKLNATGSINVPSSVTSTEADADTNNNSVTSTTTVTSGADFSVSLTAPSPLASGSSTSFTITVNNAGPASASALQVQFPLPTGFTQSGGLPGGCSISASTVTCLVNGPIASGGSVVVGAISGKITAASGSTVTGTASIALQSSAPFGTPSDPNAGNNTSVRSITVTAGSDLRLTKARSSGSSYFIGDTFNFVLTAAYDGDAPSGMTISDVIPSSYTIGTVAAVQNGWSCSVSGQTVTCTRASGAGTGNNISLGTITIPVTVNAAGGTVTNSATISASSPTDPTPGNNTATDGGALLQSPAADLTVTTSGPNPALVVVGLPFSWTLTPSNLGPSVFTGTLIVTETIPGGVTLNSVIASGYSCSPATPITGPATLTCQRVYTSGSPLASGASSGVITLDVTATASGSLTNSVSVSSSGANVADPNPGNNSASNIVTSSTGPNAADLRLIKTVDSTTIAAANVLTYTIELVNDGPATATNINLSDDLLSLINSGVGPTGQGFISQTVTNVGVASAVNCSNSAAGGSGRNVSCTIPSLPVCVQGSTCPTIQIAIRPGGDGGSRSNTATAISSSTADPSIANNSGVATMTVSPRADVTITKTGTPDPVSAGQNLTYVVTAINNGPSLGANVTVTDSLPLDVFFVSATPSSGSCATKPTASSVTAPGNRTIVCNLGSINNAAQRTVTIVTRPTNVTRGTSLTNIARVTTTTTELDSPNTSDNRTTFTSAVNNAALDLLVNKVESVDPVAIGDPTVYTITVNNIGPSDAENVVVTDSLPATGLSYQSHTPNGFTCTTVPSVNSLGGVLQCTIARIVAGGSASMTVTMQGVTKGVYTNVARVTSDETDTGFDGDMSNNRAPQATTVRTRADMQVVSKTPSVATIAVRRPYTWVIKVRNNSGAGLTEADTVKVTDALPTGMELTAAPTVAIVAGTTTRTTCTGTAGSTSFTCDLGTVSSGGEVDITVPVRNLTVPAGGTSTNPASVTTTSLDVTPGNNSGSGVVTVAGSSLAGLVFRDFNNNAASDAGDTGINSIGITITGTAFDGSAVSRTTSTTSGTFNITGLPEGTYNIQRGTVSETFLTLGTQTAGTSGGTATTPPNISAITLGEMVTATDYRFAYVPQARIGLAKRIIGTPVANTDGSITAVLRILARNYSLETLNTVAITDALTGAAPAFGTFVAGGSAATLTAGTYTINAAPTINGTCTGGTPNAAFDGSSTTQLATITTLAASAQCEFNFTLRYAPTVPLPGGNYTNQA